MLWGKQQWRGQKGSIHKCFPVLLCWPLSPLLRTTVVAKVTTQQIFFLCFPFLLQPEPHSDQVTLCWSIGWQFLPVSCPCSCSGLVACLPCPAAAPPAVAVGPQGDSRRCCNNNLSLGPASLALSHTAYLPAPSSLSPFELSKLSPTQKCHKQQSQQESDRSPGRGSWRPKPQGRRISQWNMYHINYTPIDSVLVSLSVCGVMQYSLW